jgi:cellulose synthase/poly-beta-1,6-N-acetylglucosamine synthase-like glycosyltransferase
MRQPTIALIVPSLTGETRALQTSVARQTMRPQETVVVVNIHPAGRARNAGVQRTSGEIVLFIDDDAVLGNEHAIANMVIPLLADPSVGVTGASKLLPPDASDWQRYVAREVPRIEHPIVERLLETNPDPPSYYCEITTTCCAMRREVFEQAGGFDERLLRGEDPEFFVRVRRLGYRFLLVPRTWVYHPAPATLPALLKKHFYYGLGHAQEVRVDPTRARGRYLRTPLHAAAYLLFRTAIVVPNTFLPFSFSAPSWRPGFKPLKALTSYVGALGYVWGWYTTPCD